MTVNVKVTKRAAKLPTLDDVASRRVSLDDYELAHGEDIPERTADDFARARPMRETFPEIVEAFERARGQRGPQKALIKDRIGLRLDHDVVSYFRSTGPGWQSRINDLLAEHVKRQSK